MKLTMNPYPKKVPLKVNVEYLVYRRGWNSFGFDIYQHTTEGWEAKPELWDKHWKRSRPDEVIAWCELPDLPKKEGWNW